MSIERMDHGQEGQHTPYLKKPNTGHQVRREAGAQWTLYAVVCMPSVRGAADKAAHLMR